MNFKRSVLKLFWLLGLSIVTPMQVSAMTFEDVPTTNFAYSFIETFATTGITGGCADAPPRYCPNDSVSRAQMAVFIERGMKGGSYQPQPATGTVFLDVAATSFGAAYIEQFFRDGITNGCANNRYCPGRSVTRAEMAIFILKAVNGPTYTPPSATGQVFTDVRATDFGAAYIEQFSREGITGGCGPDIFCPNGVVTRAQMAVFLVKAFNLGGGGGGGSFVISTDVGPNGSIFPETRSVTAGEAGFEFVVTPADGFRVDTIGGCDDGANDVLGDIDGNTYITGVINASCTISVTFAPVETLAIAPEFPIFGANWNDYVVSTGGPASDVACTQNSEECVHGGERRKVIVTGKNSCDDLSIAEELGGFIPGPGFGNFFNWECRINSSGVAEFVSTGLVLVEAVGTNCQIISPYRSVDLVTVCGYETLFREMIDFGSGAFKPNSIVVYYKGSVYGESLNTIDSTWNNVVEFVSPNGGTQFLDQQGTIYLVRGEVTGKFQLAANKVSLLVEGFGLNNSLGTIIGPPSGGDDSYVVQSTGADFLWFEGQIDADRHEVALRLQGSNFSTVQHGIFVSANDGTNTNTSIDVGLELDGSNKNRLGYMYAKGNVGHGILLNRSSDNLFSPGFRVNGNAQGILLRNSSLRNIFGGDFALPAGLGDLRFGLPRFDAESNGDTGFRIESSSNGNSVDGFLTVALNRIGLSLDSVAENNFLETRTFVNTSSGIHLFLSNFNTFNTVTAEIDGSGGSNEGGIVLVGASDNVFLDTATDNSNGNGLALRVNVANSGPDTYSDSNTFGRVTAQGSLTDIVLQDSAGNTFTTVDALTCSVSPVSGNERPRPSTNPGLDNNCNPVP